MGRTVGLPGKGEEARWRRSYFYYALAAALCLVR